MSKTFPLFVLLLAAALVASAQSGRRIAPRPAEPIPATPARPETPTPAAPLSPRPAEPGAVPESVMSREFQSLQGGRIRLADYGGKVVVLNLWATWCGPCRREMPELEQTRRSYAGRGVEFVALSVEDSATSADKVRGFVREVGLGARVGWIERGSAVALMRGQNFIPQTFVIDGDGRLVRRLRGYAPGRSMEMLRDAIAAALGD